jgi:hypothetical protein
MRDVEEVLNMKKVQIEELEVPKELDARLRSALYSTEKQNPLLKWRPAAAVIVFLLVISVLNYDVLAYLGRKILGYDEVVYGNIAELNELGMGQEINKSYRFKNGMELFVDGIMFDDNKLVVMYRLTAGSEEQLFMMTTPMLKGKLKGYHPRNGHGVGNEDWTKMTVIYEYEPPVLFERTLTFSITSLNVDISNGETAEITFKLDRNKAIKRMLVHNINQTVEFAGTRYQFDRLSATPMSVTLEGQIIPSEEDADVFAGKTGRRRNLHLQLVQSYKQDDRTVTEEVQLFGMNLSGASGEPVTFSYQFNGLKQDVQKLVINVVKSVDEEIIDRSIPVSGDTKNISVTPDTDDLLIAEVKEDNGETIVVFHTVPDLSFVTALFVGAKQSNLLSESSQTILLNGTERVEITYRFASSGNDMRLMFKTVGYETHINKQIIILE